MKKLRDIIEGKEQWLWLMVYISMIEENRTSNPNISLDGSKSLLESIAKTILENKGVVYDSQIKFGPLIKKTFEILPVFIAIESKDQESTIKILNAFCTIANSIGEFRNTHGAFSHGHDLHGEKFNRYLVELTISSAELLSSFLILAHAEDFNDRKRFFYEDCSAFNEWFDINNELPEIWGIILSSSKALFEQDIEAYKEKFYEFWSDSEAILDAIEIVSEDDKKEQLINQLYDIPALSIEQFNRFWEMTKDISESIKSIQQATAFVDNSGLIKAIQEVNKHFESQFAEIRKASTTLNDSMLIKQAQESVKLLGAVSMAHTQKKERP